MHYLIEIEGTSMVDVTYVSGNESLIDKIAPLWEELNKQHLCLSPYFKITIGF